MGFAEGFADFLKTVRDFGVKVAMRILVEAPQELARVMKGPPDIDDEAATRSYMADHMVLAGIVVSETPTDIDDAMITWAASCVIDDGTWEDFYPLVQKLLGDGVVDGVPPVLVGKGPDGFTESDAIEWLAKIAELIRMFTD